MTVYQLKATGSDWFTESKRTVYSTTVFLSREVAESKFDTFRHMLEERHKLLNDKNLVLSVVPLEVVE
jgi:hypothetical protein